MNDQAFKNKVTRDLNRTKEDLARLGDDGSTGLNRMFSRLAEDAKEKVAVAGKTVDKEIGQGLSQYNQKIQELVDRVPGGFGKKASRYPWVTITVSMVIGLLLGGLLKPSRQLIG